MGPANRSVRKQTDPGARWNTPTTVVPAARDERPDDGRCGRGGQPGAAGVAATAFAVPPSASKGCRSSRDPTDASRHSTSITGTSRGWPPTATAHGITRCSRDSTCHRSAYPNRPAPLLTKTLLFIGEGSNAVSGTADIDWAWGKKFRAYDKATGQVIWETELPSGTTAGPMTYMLKGKQFIVVSVGARESSARVCRADASVRVTMTRNRQIII